MRHVLDYLLRGPIRKVSVLGLVVTGLAGVGQIWGFDPDTADKILQTWAILGPIGVALGAFIATSQTTPVNDPVLTRRQLDMALDNIDGHPVDPASDA